MKSIFSFLLFLIAGNITKAQQCEGYYFMQNGKTITITNYGRKEKVTGTIIHKITTVQQKNDGLWATIHSDIFDDQKSIATTESQVVCSNGLYKMDLRMMLNQQQIRQLNNYDASIDFFIDYPSVMKVGDALESASFTMKSENKDGLNSNLTMNIDDRTVVAQENITTAAGTWECFRIRSHISLKAVVAGISIPFNIDNIEWFVPGFGIVKSETKSTRSEITSIK